jgi:FkbM family methyltransferase
MGATSLVLHDLVGRDNLLVVEADARNLALGRHNFQLNNKDIRAEFAFLVAGRPVPATVPFFSNENPSSSSGFEREATEFADEVPARSFEETLEREGSTVLVLDIEGGEYPLFTRAESFHSVRLILMEAHPWVIGAEKMAELLKSLGEHGFALLEDIADGRFLVFGRECTQGKSFPSRDLSQPDE